MDQQPGVLIERALAPDENPAMLAGIAQAWLKGKAARGSAHVVVKPR